MFSPPNWLQTSDDVTRTYLVDEETDLCFSQKKKDLCLEMSYYIYFSCRKYLFVNKRHKIPRGRFPKKRFHSGKIQHTQRMHVLGFSIAAVVIILEMITPVPSDISVAICMPAGKLPVPSRTEQLSSARRPARAVVNNMTLSKIRRSSLLESEHSHCLCSEPIRFQAGS